VAGRDVLGDSAIKKDSWLNSLQRKKKLVKLDSARA
jgi:hypothetical protein